LSSKLPVAPKACRLRTSPASSQEGRAGKPGSLFFLLAHDFSVLGAPLKALPEGQYIKHFQYGLGVITESDHDRTSIDFDLHGMKKFVTSIMVVEIAEGTPPKRKRAKRVKKTVAAIAAAAGSSPGAK
jgi:hypothetical protein